MPGHIPEAMSIRPRDEPKIDGGLRQFLSQPYDMEAISDYGATPDGVPTGQAAGTIEKAERFLAAIASLLPYGAVAD
jgi:hypothetical protein